MQPEISGRSYRNIGEMGRQFPHAASSALNKMARQIRTESSKEIRRGYAIKKRDIDPHIRLEPSTARTLRAVLRASSTKIPLGQFTARVARARGKASPGVYVKVKRGQKKLIPRAFLAKMQYSYGVYLRKSGGHRGEVRHLYGPAAAELFGAKHIRDFVDRMLVDKFPALLLHEIQFRLSRASTTSSTGSVYDQQGELVTRGASE